MKFEWDSAKNEVNIKKHGIDFKEAESVFEDEMALIFFDDKHSFDEDRFIIIGISRKLRELTVCHCHRNGDDITRIISARRATKIETELYNRGMKP